MSESFTSGTPQVEIGETQSPFSIEKVSELTTGSFRHSQGSGTAQTHIIDYIAIRYGDRLTDPVLDATLPIVSERITRYLSNDKGKTHMQVDLSYANVASEIAGHFTRLKNNRNLPADRLPAVTYALLGNIVEREHELLVDGGGRPRSSDEGSRGPRPTSTYLSALAYYGLGKHTTGSEEYDALYQGLVATLTQARERMDANEAAAYSSLRGVDELGDRRIVTLAQRAITVHLEHYPSELDRIPESWRPATGITNTTLAA